MKELLETFKDRFKRPFTSAFIFCWIFSNWQILVILFKYDANSYDIISLIKEQIHWCNSLICPFLEALGIIFGIGQLNTFVEKLRKEWFIERQKLNEHEEELKTNLEKLRLDNKYNRLSDIIKDPNNIALLDGDWRLKFGLQSDNGKSIAVLVIEISGGNVFPKYDKSDVTNLKWGIKSISLIEHIAYNVKKSILHMVVIYIDSQGNKIKDLLRFRIISDYEFYIDSIEREQIKYAVHMFKYIESPIHEIK